jgi:hypothetical protein
MKKNKFIFVLIVFCFFSQLLNAGEKFEGSKYSPVYAFTGYFRNIINQEALIINDNSLFYKDIVAFECSGILNFKDKVTVIDIDMKHYYLSNKKYNIFLKVKNKDGKTGWIKNTDIAWPYILTENEMFGVKIESDFFKPTNEQIAFLSFFYKNDKLNLEQPLFKLYREKRFFISRSFDVHEIVLNDRSYDNREKIVLKGINRDGIWESDAAVDEAQLWLNLDNNKINEVFLFKIKGSFSFYSEWKYDYRFIDDKKDGFVDKIISTKTVKSDKSLLDPDFDNTKDKKYKIQTEESYYIWNKFRYEEMN